MNKWAATSLVLLIAILCGTIHGAVLREQQQPLDAVHQQAPDHINETEKTDTDNAKSEKPGPNPKTSEPEKFPDDPNDPATTTPSTTKPPRPVDRRNGTDTKNTSDSSMTSTTRMPPASNETKGNETGLYEPKDNPDIKRNYTANLVYWNDVTQMCYRKANASEKADKPINGTDIRVINSAEMTDATAKTETPSGNNTIFNAWSYCAKVQFYGNLGLDDAKTYFGKEKATQKKEFSDMRDFENGGFMQDMVLLLIDGRIECKSAKEDMDGKISELCGEEKMHEFGNTTVTLEKGTSYFVFGVVLRERLCPHNKVPGTPPNNTGDLVIEELKYKYENVKLTVAHSCMGKKLVTIKLRPIDVFEMDRLDRVLQLRDLTLDLSMLVDDDVMLEKGAEMKDSISGIYYLPSIGAG
uniref:Uncharacterized protein n=1 Tax=Globodera rostochiensis TaxID=31243 RepID=A0A914IE14_GLORO